MMTGKTSSGFEYNVEDEALNDWELLEGLVSIDEGHFSAVIPVSRRLLGEEQLKSLKEHCRDEKTGRIPRNAMITEISEILNGAGSNPDESKTKNA